MGLQKLYLSAGQQRVGLAALWVLLPLSSGLDLYHLYGPYQKIWRSGDQPVILQSKSMEKYQAYQLLGSMSRAKGPGLIFTEFESTPFDQTFSTAVYPLNAAHNPHLSSSLTLWAGLLTNIDYTPFLTRRFPEGRWFPLTSTKADPPGTLVLGIIPLTPENQKELSTWLEAEKALHPITSLLFHSPFGKPPVNVLDQIIRLEPSLRGDPFLESCVAEKIFFYGMSCGDDSRALEALSRALQTGYPAANLFNDLGVLWYSMGNPVKAREAFQAACFCPSDHTSARMNLRAIPPFNKNQ
jgi:hypothetical protein